MSAAFEQILSHKDLKGSQVGIVIRDLDAGQIVYEKNGGAPLVPASNQKILIAAAAYASLGPDYRIPTSFYSKGFHADSGVLDGLLVKGFGDPSLSHKFYDSSNAAVDWMAASLVEKGVREIKGAILLDESFFPAREYPANWKAEDKPYCYAPKLGALSVAGNCMRATLSLDGKGQPVAQVDPWPGSEYVKLNLSKASKKTWGQIKGDGLDVRITGAVGQGRTVEMERPVSDPSLFFGASLAANLKRRGVKFSGEIKAVRLDPEKSGYVGIYRHEGRPLSEVLKIMMRESDNFIAEQVLWSLGGIAGQGAGEEGGRRAVADFLSKIKAEGLEGLKVDDGSGLSRSNRLTARTIVSVLGSYHRSAHASGFRDLFAVPGGNGTLEKRLTGADTNGRIWAKTGAIRGVCTISGYFRMKNGDMAAFSMLFNGFEVHASRIRSVQDRLLKAMAASI